MPAQTTPATQPTDLIEVLEILKDHPVKAVCFKRSEWFVVVTNKLERKQRDRAIRMCRDCDRRALCAAWAFSMDECCVWGGFSEDDRKQLKATHPNMIGELVMRVRALVNTTDGLGGRMRRGEVRDVADRFGAILVSKGHAEAMDIVEQLDQALLGLVPDLPTPVIDIPMIDVGTISDEQMGVNPPEDPE